MERIKNILVFTIAFVIFYSYFLINSNFIWSILIYITSLYLVLKNLMFFFDNYYINNSLSEKLIIYEKILQFFTGIFIFVNYYFNLSFTINSLLLIFSITFLAYYLVYFNKKDILTSTKLVLSIIFFFTFYIFEIGKDYNITGLLIAYRAILLPIIIMLIGIILLINYNES